MFEVQQNFSYIAGLECLILNADKKKQSNPNKKGADLSRSKKFDATSKWI